MASQVSNPTATGAVDFLKPSSDTIVILAVSGASYTGLTFDVKGSLDGIAFFSIPAISENSSAVLTGSISPADGTTVGYRIPSEGLSVVRANISVLTVATSLALTFQSSAHVGSVSAGAPGGVAMSTVSIDTSTAAALNIGPTTATSVAITPNTTIAGTLGVTGATTLAAVSATSITATGTVALTNNMTVTEAKNVVLGTTTGTKLGTATTQKLGLWNATPIVQPANTVDVFTGLVNVGLRASGGSAACTLPGALSCAALTATSIAATGTVALTDNLTVTDAKNVVLNATTGTKIGTATTQKLGFFNATPVVQPAASTDATTGAAGSTTSVFLNTTFTGAAGTAAYTVGGVVTALKALGLLAP